MDFGLARIGTSEMTRGRHRHGHAELHVAGAGERRAARTPAPTSSRWARCTTSCSRGRRRSTPTPCTRSSSRCSRRRRSRWRAGSRACPRRSSPSSTGAWTRTRRPGSRTPPSCAMGFGRCAKPSPPAITHWRVTRAWPHPTTLRCRIQTRRPSWGRAPSSRPMRRRAPPPRERPPSIWGACRPRHAALGALRP